MAKVNKNPYQVNYYREGGVAILPLAVLASAKFCNLTYAAKTILCYIALQYNGYNNGDLSACLTLLRQYGFRSQDTITNSIKSLIAAELIERTRVGGKNFKTGCNLPALYAITWQPINECNGKIDVLPTRKPSIDFISELKAINR